MLKKRVIPCLDVRNGRVTKGVKFKDNVDLGDPVEMAVGYCEGGADELVFYDITASAERRPIDIGMVEAVARAVRIPFAVGGAMPGVAERREYYFVHSYCAQIVPETCGVSEYAGVKFTAMARKGRFWACQFHPEKSGRLGLDLLRRWLSC